MRAKMAGKGLQIYSSFVQRAECRGSICIADLSYRIFLTRNARPLPETILKEKEGRVWHFVSHSKLPHAAPLGRDGFLELAILNFRVHAMYSILLPDEGGKKALHNGLLSSAMLPILDHLAKITGGAIHSIVFPKEKNIIFPIPVLRRQLESLQTKRQEG